ncbi:MAG: LPXTG cell wall anchor domain-containing protein [Acidimicrobiales bacterium]
MASAVAATGFAAAPAWAQAQTVIEIPLNTVVRGAAGSEHLLETEAIAPEDVGRECTVAAEGANNSSIHPNTDLLVRSGGSEVVVPDVERAANVRTDAAETIVLGTDVSVSVRLGPDGVFSGGLVVTIECEEPPPTTTTSTTTTTTTVPEDTTTSAAPTTTAPAAAPTLPKTGGGSDGLLVAAGISLLIGGATLFGARLAKQRHGLTAD